MHPTATSERRSLCIIVLALALALLLGTGFLRDVWVRQEGPRNVRIALDAIRRDDPTALRPIIKRVRDDETEWDFVLETASGSDTPEYKPDGSSVLPLLLEAGWSPDGKAGNGLPLYTASLKGRTSVVRTLIQYGADVNLRHPDDGATALFAAVRGNHLPVVGALLEAGADPDIPLKIQPYRRRLHIGPLPGPPPTTYREYERREKALSDEIREKIEAGTTPLMCAAYSGNAELMRLLLKYGADPHRRTLSGRTALEFARRFEQPETIRILKGIRSSRTALTR